MHNEFSVTITSLFCYNILPVFRTVLFQNTLMFTALFHSYHTSKNKRNATIPYTLKVLLGPLDILKY